MKFSYDDIVVAAARQLFLLLQHSNNLVQSMFRGLYAIYQGIIPPLLGYERLHKLNTLIYDNESLYVTEKHNMQGLWQWEQEAIGEYLASEKRFIVLGAGAGREVIALASKGIKVDAWECNEKLRAYGNTLLENNKFSCRILSMEQNLFPVIPNGRYYDFCIISWGTYSHIFPREYRIQLLKKCKNIVKGPVLVSYLAVYMREGKSKLIWSFVRKIILSMPWSCKDIHPDINIYPYGVYEGINQDKIKAEAAEAGYGLRMVKDSPYLHAVLTSNST